MSKILLASIVAGVVLVTAVPGVMAKGTSSTSNILVINGPCSDEFVMSQTGYTAYYPLPHQLGTVGVNMNMLTGTPRLDSVCMPTGWTVSGGNVTGGIQLSFAKDESKAIDFKYVLGKTDIKFR